MVNMKIMIIAWGMSVAVFSVELSLHSSNIFKLLFGQGNKKKVEVIDRHSAGQYFLIDWNPLKCPYWLARTLGAGVLCWLLVCRTIDGFRDTHEAVVIGANACTLCVRGWT